MVPAETNSSLKLQTDFSSTQIDLCMKQVKEKKDPWFASKHGIFAVKCSECFIVMPIQQIIQHPVLHLEFLYSAQETTLFDLSQQEWIIFPCIGNVIIPSDEV